MHIHILQVVGRHDLRSNKDTNGGFGTMNDFGQGLVSRALKWYKNRSMNFPELLPAYVSAILKSQGKQVTYGCNSLDPSADLALIQTSITHHYTELDWAKRIRQDNPGIMIGFMGGFSSANPHLYQEHGDFIVQGEIENALLQGNVEDFRGLVEGGLLADLDDLPFPDWSSIQNWKAGYGLVSRRKERLLPMSSSRGCPMTCAYYCTYPLTQGRKLRTRSPESVVEEAKYLQKDFGMTGVMPTPRYTVNALPTEEQHGGLICG